MLTFRQALHHPFPAESVFPLLCPVRESEWLHGWKAEMIHSESGIIEQDAVFLTPHKSGSNTMWVVTNYDQDQFHLSFVRATDKVEVVLLDIRLHPNGDSCTAEIEYRFVPFEHGRVEHLQRTLPQRFPMMMEWWEKSLNHFLSTGDILKPESAT